MLFRNKCSAWLGLAGACLFVIGCGSDVPDPASDSKAADGSARRRRRPVSRSRHLLPQKPRRTRPHRPGSRAGPGWRRVERPIEGSGRLDDLGYAVAPLGWRWPRPAPGGRHHRVGPSGRPPPAGAPGREPPGPCAAVGPTWARMRPWRGPAGPGMGPGGPPGPGGGPRWRQRRHDEEPAGEYAEADAEADVAEHGGRNMQVSG